MITHKEIEPLENSSVKLHVTIDKQAVNDEYNELLKKYSKTARIKGFRKGKVPTSVLERKFGDSIKQEASANIIEKSLKEVFQEIDEKPLPYSTPELQEDLEPDLEKDLTFSVVYDVYPEVELGEYRGLEIEAPEVEVTEEDEEREIEELRERNSVVVDKEDGVVEQDSIVTVDYVEVDENDNEIEDTKREGFVFTVGSGYNLYKFDDDIIGMKNDEEKILEKEYPEDYEYEELQGRSVRLKVKVTAVKEKQLPELDDEFAQDISDEYETFDDLKQHISKRLNEVAEEKVKEIKMNKLLDKIIENSEVEVPESMIKLELENSWQNFINRSRLPENQLIQMLQYQGKDKDSLLQEWRPEVEKNVKTQLLIDKMIEKENIEISDNEIEEEMQKYAEENNKSLDEVKEEFSQGRANEYLRHELERRKLFETLLEASTINTGERMKFLDVMQDNQ